MQEYGPFLTIVALAGTAVATTLTLMRIFGAKYSGWRPPDQGLPQRLLTGVVAAVVSCLFAVFLLITPANKMVFLFVGLGLVFLFAMLIPLYQGQVNIHFYKKPSRVAKDENGNEYVAEWITVVGGKKLLAEAEKQKKKNNISDQDLLSGTDPEPYDEDKLWDRADRQSVQTKMSYLLMGLLTSGLAGLILVLFAAQVYITNVRPGFSAEKLKELESSVTKAKEPANQ